MKTRNVEIAGHAIEIAEEGDGAPLLYLHGFADLHAASRAFLPFHAALANGRRLIAPAHPACAGSEEDEDIEGMDDLVLRYIELLDQENLPRLDIVGACAGGWIAAEIAARYPERVGKLVLIGASGLYVENEPIGDLFWEAQPETGNDFSSLRRLLFARADLPEALALFPDSRSDVAREVERYKAMRFASRIGFSPPYFYDRKLRGRLHRFKGPALLIWGADDRMVPRAHAKAYAQSFPNARLEVIAGAGHSPHVEKPDATAGLVAAFLK
jgi:pimeloyl-ACP methyl ester carboxylesterase